MWKVFLVVLPVLAVAIGLVWRKWIAPWSEVEQIVREVGRGSRPRTFVVTGARPAGRIGIALEKLFLRQEDLSEQVMQRTSRGEAIFSAMADGLMVVDAQRRVLIGNPAFREIFKIPSLTPGEPLRDLVRNPIVDQLVEQALQRDRRMEEEVALSGPDRFLAVSAVPMKNRGGVVILFHDITELKRSDLIRSEFVANVSHELRTPLSILRGYLETLLEDPETPPEELRRILEVMDRHARRLGLIADDLLSLAQLESDTPDLQISSVRLESFLANVARDWEKKLAEKNLKVVLDLDPQLSVVHADETRLHEVLYNLIDNSVKYSRAGDEIRLRAVQRDGHIVLSVIDRGPGIAPNDLPRIFERFYRADKARSREFGGTGLGLAIVKHIAQQHGGRVEAESELGQGTKIHVILPLPAPTPATVTES